LCRRTKYSLGDAGAWKRDVLVGTQKKPEKVAPLLPRDGPNIQLIPRRLAGKANRSEFAYTSLHLVSTPLPRLAPRRHPTFDELFAVYPRSGAKGTFSFVNLRLLIDGIVRQTTVLIAQLSTASGVRSPLSHVADQVFIELSREIEAQGVRQQVAADMFGMALRSYQKKTRRLAESETVRERTLWEAVLELIENEQPTRARVTSRFSRDGEREVASVLKDLVKSGLVSVTGAGERAVYTATSESLRGRLMDAESLDTVANVAWLKVFRKEATSRREMVTALGIDEQLTERALEELITSGRVTETDGLLVSQNLVLPLGEEHGWEAAVLDHFRTVAVAIATKLRRGRAGMPMAERTGGSTFTFTVEPGHPYENEVDDLLATTRKSVQSLWDKVSEYNREHPPSEERSRRVSFYLGQSVELDEE
jgi:hypothetical protein